MDIKGAQVMFANVLVCFSFEDFSRLRALAEPKVVPYGRVVDNTLLKHVFRSSPRERGT